MQGDHKQHPRPWIHTRAASDENIEMIYNSSSLQGQDYHNAMYSWARPSCDPQSLQMNAQNCELRPPILS